MKKNLFAVALLASLVSPVMAGDFYLVGDVGRGKFNLDDDGDSYTQSDTAFTVGAGFQFASNVGVELAYRELLRDAKLNIAEDVSNEVTVDALQISVIGSLPVSSTTSVYGRLGYARLESKVSWFDSYWQVGGSDKASANKAFFGVGARYAITQKIGLRVELDRYAKWDEAELSALTLGVDYHF